MNAMRIHFTRADLVRTQLAEGPDPMWELVNSLQALQSRYGQAVFGSWRRRVATDLRHADLAALAHARLFPVAPHARYFPDLLTPPEAALGLDEGIDAVLHTPRHRYRTELGKLAARPGSGGWMDDLSAGRPAAVGALGDALRAYHRHAVAPYWSRLRTWVDRDLATRRRVLRGGGIEKLLDSFRPMMRWRYPVLELPGHPSDRDVHLGGRGLVLVPSYFCWLHPVTIFDGMLPQVIVYPVQHHRGWLSATPDRADGSALAKLLGTTRAAVLRAALDGGTTGELARRLGLSPAAVSHHTAVLRGAGLIASQRTANTVLHVVTPLGSALVGQRAPTTGA